MRIARILAVLTALVLLTTAGAALADEPEQGDFDQRAASWFMIRQNDPHYDHWRFQWHRDKLSVRGCGPVCIANAWIAAYDVRDQETVDLMLRETLHLMAHQHMPSRLGINLGNLAEFMTLEENDYPTLYALKTGFPGTYTYTEELMDLASVRSAAEPALEADEGVMVIGRVSQADRWRTVAELCGWLSSIGRGDALVIVAYVSGGTEGTGAPFCTRDGHYMTVLVQAEEFARCGGIYVLDSLPRAIQGEAYENNTYYSQYNFVQAYECNPFRHIYTVKRIRREIIKLELLPEKQEELAGLTGPARIDAETDMMKEIRMYGEGILMVSLPKAAQPDAGEEGT